MRPAKTHGSLSYHRIDTSNLVIPGPYQPIILVYAIAPVTLVVRPVRIETIIPV
ncbi:hypothetical protein LF1_37790 [Rubripirellula obstinata]|uniref:Uncharacterized protein n=1 Tax=Rubripirellula obstinata TaxID=406547 RepID=A0A5B1CPE7_9BACT|nr:hypothetical protein LF1_37790 [Rubripirellula obstinata]